MEGRVEDTTATHVSIRGEMVELAEDGSFATTLTLEDGRHEVTATADSGEARVEFRVDSIAPEIVLSSPQPGTYLSGDTVTIEGQVQDASQTTLFIDGTEVDVNDGRFQTTLALAPGGHHVQLRATDEAGHLGSAYSSFLLGDYLHLAEPVRRGTEIALGQDGVDALLTGANALVQNYDFESKVADANPVVDAWWGEVDITNLDFHSVEISTELQNGSLIVIADIDNLDVDVNVDNTGPGSIDGGINATVTTVRLPTTLDVSEGRPTVTLGDATVSMTGFDFHMDLVPSFVENWEWVESYVRRKVEEQLTNAVVEMVPDYLASAIEGLPLAGDYIDVYEGIALWASLADIDVAPEGLSVRADVNVVTDGMRADRTPGSFSSGSAAPMLSELPSGIAATLSFDGLNRAAHAAWDLGYLSRRFDGLAFNDAPLTVGVVSLLLPSAGGHAPADAPVIVEVDSALPPVLVATADGKARVDVADLRVRFLANVDGQDTQLAVLSIGAQATATIVEDAAALRFNIEAPSIEIDFVERIDNATTEALEQIAQELIESKLEELVGLAAIPIPEMAGFSLVDLSGSVHEQGIQLTAGLRYGTSDPGAVEP